jgi:hypothetical protein
VLKATRKLQNFYIKLNSAQNYSKMNYDGLKGYLSENKSYSLKAIEEM